MIEGSTTVPTIVPTTDATTEAAATRSFASTASAKTVVHASSRIAITTPFTKFYNDSVFLEVSNASVAKLLLLYFIFFVMFIILLCIAICALRFHYRRKLLDELDNVRQDNEHGRVYYVEEGSEARRVVPPPLSPPLTEQQVYYPLGQMLADEARRAAL